jgi:hypothetical protein
MSYASTPETIRQFFNDCGEVKDARIATDKESGKVFNYFYLGSRLWLCGILWYLKCEKGSR